MNKSEILFAIEPVIKAFDELGILYYISGSVASSAYGLARATLDVDMVLNLQPFHIEPLVNKLKDKYYIDFDMISEAIKSKTSFNIFQLETMIKIDIFLLKNQPYHLKAFERKVKDKLLDEQDSIQIYLATPEDIILNKLEWFNLGGQVSEKQWSDIIGVLKVQHQNIDREYLTYWAKELNLEILLNRAFAEVGM